MCDLMAWNSIWNPAWIFVQILHSYKTTDQIIWAHNESTAEVCTRGWLYWDTVKITHFNKTFYPANFRCFTVDFDSLSFIHTNSCTFSYNYVSVF